MSLICPECGDNRVVYFQGTHRCKECGEEFKKGDTKGKKYIRKALLIGSAIVITLSLVAGLILSL